MASPMLSAHAYQKSSCWGNGKYIYIFESVKHRRQTILVIELP